MPYDSNGNYTLPDTYFVENGDTVLPIQHNPPLEDIQSALSAVLLRSGVAPMTGNLNMGTKKIVSLADGTGDKDAINKSQLDAAVAILTDPWAFQPIGAYIAHDDAVVGLVAPPKDKAYRYVELTAGLTGSGAYNERILTTETVSGSAPLISATAVINLTDSPLNGKTIRLINTERRFLRAGSAGTLQDDAMQDFSSLFQTRRLAGGESIFVGTSGAFSLNPASGPGAARINAGGDTALSSDQISFVLSGSSARTANETRSRNIGVKFYRRIK